MSQKGEAARAARAEQAMAAGRAAGRAAAAGAPDGDCASRALGALLSGALLGTAPVDSERCPG